MLATQLLDRGMLAVNSRGPSCRCPASYIACTTMATRPQRHVVLHDSRHEIRAQQQGRRCPVARQEGSARSNVTPASRLQRAGCTQLCQLASHRSEGCQGPGVPGKEPQHVGHPQGSRQKQHRVVVRVCQAASQVHWQMRICRGICCRKRSCGQACGYLPEHCPAEAMYLPMLCRCAVSYRRLAPAGSQVAHDNMVPHRASCTRKLPASSRDRLQRLPSTITVPELEQPTCHISCMLRRSAQGKAKHAQQQAQRGGSNNCLQLWCLAPGCCLQGSFVQSLQLTASTPASSIHQ